MSDTGRFIEAAIREVLGELEALRSDVEALRVNQQKTHTHVLEILDKIEQSNKNDSEQWQ